MQDKTVLRDEISIQALPSKVWVVLTEPDYTRQYFFDSAILSEWTQGSEVITEAMDDETVALKNGTILESIPGLLLRFTLPEKQMRQASIWAVAYELFPEEGGVRLRLSQEICHHTAEIYHSAHQNSVLILQKIKWLAEYA